MKWLASLSTLILSLEVSPSCSSRGAVTFSSSEGPPVRLASLSRPDGNDVGADRFEEELFPAAHVPPSLEGNEGGSTAEQEALEEAALPHTDQTEKKNVKALAWSVAFLLISVILSTLVHELVVFPRALALQEEAGEKNGFPVIDDEAAYNTVLEEDQLSSATSLSTGLLFLAAVANFLYRVLRVVFDKTKGLSKLIRRSSAGEGGALQEEPVSPLNFKKLLKEDAKTSQSSESAQDSQREGSGSRN
ncbi:hypothetical protein Emag_002742 [Eimeria magna]